MNRALKVCRVDTVLGAKLTGFAGADFVGLHAISPEAFDDARADRLQRAAMHLTQQAPECVPVLVTRSVDPIFIVRAMRVVGVHLVQIHSKVRPLDILPELHRECRRAGVAEPVVIKNVPVQALDDLAVVREWAPWSYAILMDRDHVGGTGIEIDWPLAGDAVRTVGHGRSFIAGGLKATNVETALTKSGAWGADVQSSLELKDQKNPYQKLPEKVLEMVALVHGLPQERAGSAYRWRRCRPRLLFSPTELAMGEGEAVLRELVSSDIDGVQIDAADGSVGVPTWSIGVQEWAAVARSHLPEAPIWIHCFSREREWIASTVRTAMTANPHMVGLLVQCHGSISASQALCDSLEQDLGMPVVLSLSVGQVEKDETLAYALERRRSWQLTTPADPERRAERVSLAIARLRASGAVVHLDRGVDVPLLESLACKPDGVTLGRSLARDRSITSRALQLLEVQ